MRDAFTSFVGIVTLIIIVAIFGVIVRKNSGTAALIQSASSAFNSLLQRGTAKA